MVSTGDRSAKIRTYNWPQGRVTDHRINYSSYNLDAVVNGEIDCTGFFSFDGTHPTAAIHRVIAGRVEQILAVPEPATWAMLITGFGLVGVALRRRESLPRAA